MRADEFIQFLIGIVVSVGVAIGFYVGLCAIRWQLLPWTTLVVCWILALVGWGLMYRAGQIRARRCGGYDLDLEQEIMLKEASQ